MGENLDRLKNRLADITHLSHAAAILSWDQTTYMPPAGAAARGEQLATLSKLVHEMSTSDEIGKLLERAARNRGTRRPTATMPVSVRVARRDYEDQRKIPASLVEALARHGAEAYGVWAKARDENDFPTFARTSTKRLTSAGSSPSTWDTRTSRTTRCWTSSSGHEEAQVRPSLASWRRSNWPSCAPPPWRLGVGGSMHQPLDRRPVAARGRSRGVMTWSATSIRAASSGT